MTKTLSPIVLSLAAASMAAMACQPASASCTRLAFSVNDYGKDGPTNDAKSLLDKYIATWAGEHKIAKYTTGKKDVNCELFLNFIVFDEHTCRAEATVCWDGPPVAGTGPESTADAASKQPAGKPKRVAAPVLPIKAPDSAKSGIETGTLPVAPIPPAEPVVIPAAVVAAPAAQLPPAIPAPAIAPPQAPAAAAAPAAQSAQAIANQAMEAARKAADSAERAAAAAERAAAAAMAAAAAKKTTVLPPAQ